VNWKRYGLAVLVVYVLLNLFGFLIHGVLLAPDYRQLAPGLLRPAEQAGTYAAFMQAGFLSFALAMVWIYSRGIESRPWPGQGFRFGLAVWLLFSVPLYLVYYLAIEPWPGSIVAAQIGSELAEMIVLGLAAAAIYRPR
jgi:hypothetical protein